MEKLLFWGRLITEPKCLLQLEPCFKAELKVSSTYIYRCCIKCLRVATKSDLFGHFKAWSYDRIFPTYTEWKRLWGEKSVRGYKEFGRTFVTTTQIWRWLKTAWMTSILTIFRPQPTNILILLNASIPRWDSCNFRFDGGVPWLRDTNGGNCLFASILLTIIVTSYLIVRASKTTLPSYGINWSQSS